MKQILLIASSLVMFSAHAGSTYDNSVDCSTYITSGDIDQFFDCLAENGN